MYRVYRYQDIFLNSTGKFDTDKNSYRSTYLWCGGFDIFRFLIFVFQEFMQIPRFVALPLFPGELQGYMQDFVSEFTGNLTWQLAMD